VYADDPATDDHRNVTGADERGFVVVWFGLLLLVLVAMAGFGVDVWNWWYTSQKVQRAADAGALAGVPFMPTSFDAASGSPNATSTATVAVTQNGIDSGVTVSKVAGKANQLEVTVTKQVSNFFTSLLGYKTTTISRKATAEFNPPIQMGSPSGHIGNDPENGATDKHWLNIGAPGVDKHTGDRYADYANCSSSNTYKCSSGGINQEYLDGTYVYTVSVPTSGGNIDIQAYDPQLAVGNQNCDKQWLTQAQRDTLKGQGYADADTRFKSGSAANDYCTGDDDTNLGSGVNPQATSWIVRDSSVSLFDPFANPVVASGGPGGANAACAHQFKGYNPSSGTYWFDLLNTTAGNTNFDQDFANSFHRWYTLCRITGATAGKYFIQVRSNVPYNASKVNDASYLSGSQDPPTSTNIAGQNRYSIRVVSAGSSVTPAGHGVYAEGRLPVYTNTLGANTPNFYLARVVPAGATSGRLLRLQFYDIGDVSGGPTSLTITPPPDATGSAISCTLWTADDNKALPSSSSVDPANSCRVNGITSADYNGGGYNGVLTTVRINLPADYDCGSGYVNGSANANACWFKITMSYANPGGTQANDTTTWSAGIGGDPIRLIK
jgi:hypothetical protein